MGCKSSTMSAPTFDEVNDKKKNEAKANFDAQKRSSNTISIKSAILIQNWYRGYQARLEARRRCSWMIYQSLEYSGEQNQLKLHNFFLDFMSLVDHQDSPKGIFSKALTKSRDLTASDDENPVKLEADYSDIQLKFPLSLNCIKSLIDYFLQDKILHAHYVYTILSATREHLKMRPNIQMVNTSLSHKVTVCGDLHGQLQDLVHIFNENNYPDISNPYVFNGDFVDRGNYSVEILVILCSFMLLHPNSVYLNRGNHEDKVLNMRYGFTKEIQLKYKNHANILLNLCSDLFRWLPLATVIDSKVFVCHGGISTRVHINSLRGVDRTKFISVLNCPSEAKSEQDEWIQLLDLLWSDPKPQRGCKPNKFRGGGCYFGPDITHQFLNKHGLDLLVRSHECRPEGYEWTHNKSVLTIFSASNYYDTGSNKGAYLQITSTGKMEDNLTYKLVSFDAAANNSMEKVSKKNSIGLVEESAMRVLRNKILTSRTTLMDEFASHDIDETGSIPVSIWSSVLAKVTELDLPWMTLRKQLADIDKNGEVIYASSFEKLLHQTPNGSTINVDNTTDSQKNDLSYEIYKYKDTLETVFRIIDGDNSGKISLDEFKEGCQILQRQCGIMMTTETMEDLAKSIDINKDGFIDLNEFLEAFRMSEDVQSQ